MSNRLVIAVPSKGRLQENTFAFFAHAGLTLAQQGGARDYRGIVKGMPGVDVLFLSASDIVAKLASGEAHFGVTGEDLIRESLPDADARVLMVQPLGFGHADVVVAVPKGWIDASTMEDLEEVAADFHQRHGRRLRVATKYINLTRRAFAEHGVADYRIVESLGATEGAPASGTAELIVDITTTGATLEANGLKVLSDGLLLRSQANLVASLQAGWSKDVLALARIMLDRIAAETLGRTTREIAVSVSAQSDALQAVITRFAAERLDGAGLRFRVAKDKAGDLAAALIAAGAKDVTVSEQAYVFTKDAPLFQALQARLKKR